MIYQNFFHFIHRCLPPLLFSLVNFSVDYDENQRGKKKTSRFSVCFRNCEIFVKTVARQQFDRESFCRGPIGKKKLSRKIKRVRSF